MTKTLALVDGDIVVHRCAVALDSPVEHVSKGLYRFDIKGAVRNAINMTRSIRDDVEADRVIFCLSSSRNYRKEFCPTYKGNRTGRKPIMFKEVREALLNLKGLECKEVDGIEADDLMGIIATSKMKKFEAKRKVICSIDKDMLTIPGLHWNWDKQDVFNKDKPKRVTKVEALRAFYRQAVTGDATDGYPGVPGIGPVSAARLITDDMKNEDEMWAAVLKAYHDKGLTTDDALVNTRCARILLAANYDFKKKEPVLWTPPHQS